MNWILVLFVILSGKEYTMGQHKYNPTAIAAKNGELQPKSKPKKSSKREREMYLHNAVENAMRKVVGIAPSDLIDTYTDGGPWY